MTTPLVAKGDANIHNHHIMIQTEILSYYIKNFCQHFSLYGKLSQNILNVTFTIRSLEPLKVHSNQVHPFMYYNTQLISTTAKFNSMPIFPTIQYTTE